MGATSGSARSLRGASRAVLGWGALLGLGAAAFALSIAQPADATVSRGPAGSVDELATCGRPGQPRCPLQAWMRTRLAQPMAGGKLDQVARSLDAVGARPPDARWTTWREHATRGAAAARRGDVAAVRRSCRDCHDAHRATYRKLHRGRPAPP